MLESVQAEVSKNQNALKEKNDQIRILEQQIKELKSNENYIYNESIEQIKAEHQQSLKKKGEEQIFLTKKISQKDELISSLNEKVG